GSEWYLKRLADEEVSFVAVLAPGVIETKVDVTLPCDSVSNSDSTAGQYILEIEVSRVWDRPRRLRQTRRSPPASMLPIGTRPAKPALYDLGNGSLDTP